MSTPPGFTAPQLHDQPLTLAIQRIEPVNMQDPSIQASLEQTRRAISNTRLHQILEIRTAVQHFLSSELVKEGYVHPPVYMLAGCTDPLNHWTYPARINYYGAEVSITQSLIFQKILMVMHSASPRVFWASPNIRMEMRIGRKEYKYSTEFMQIDFEKRDATYDEMIKTVSDMVIRLFRYLNRFHRAALIQVRGEPLPRLDELPVYDVQEIKREMSLDSDDAVERRLARRSGGRPFLVVNLRREAYDCFDEKTGRFLNYDVILPPFGDNPHPVECLSGAERTRGLDDLLRRMKELNYPQEYFLPFIRLFAAMDSNGGAITCAGGGFGVERLTYGILGLSDIHEVYPFPRMAEGKIAL